MYVSIDMFATYSVPVALVSTRQIINIITCSVTVTTNVVSDIFFPDIKVPIIKYIYTVYIFIQLKQKQTSEKHENERPYVFCLDHSKATLGDSKATP